MDERQEILINTALESSEVNCSCTECTYSNAILKQQIRKYQALLLTNEVEVFEKELENSSKEEIFLASRDKLVEDIIRKSNNEIYNFETSHEKQITELNYDIFDWDQKNSSLQKHKEQLLSTLSTPIPKFDKKSLSEYSALETRICDLKDEIEKKKTQLKTAPTNLMGFTIVDVVQNENSKTSKRTKK